MKSKVQKRHEAIVRQVMYDRLSPFQKLKKLDGIYGLESGARKERYRLTHSLCQYISNLPKRTDSLMMPILKEIKEGEYPKELPKPIESNPEPFKPRVRLIIPTEGKEQEAR